MTLKYVMAH